jgi:hypothetical protein
VCWAANEQDIKRKSCDPEYEAHVGIDRNGTWPGERLDDVNPGIQPDQA